MRKKTPEKKATPKKTIERGASDHKTKEIIEALLGPVLVQNPEFHITQGSLDINDVTAIWTWLVRDSDGNLPDEAMVAISAPEADKALGALSLKVANLIGAGIAAAKKDPVVAKRIQIQLGNQETFAELSHVELAFRHQQLLGKSVAFGKAINGVKDENSLKLALQTFPVDDPAISAFMMHAALGQVQNPNRLVSVILDLSDGNSQRAITRAGFASAIDALIAHAQSQIIHFTNTHSRFADVDLICHALDRYHRLIRAVSSVTENDKTSHWANSVAHIVRRMSALIEPRLTKVDADIRQSLRKARSGPDRLDADLLFDALNGLYLLAAVREALDALALNNLVNKLWGEIGKALEILISRNLDAYRQDPQDDILAERLNTGIKMAEIRFNPEYASIMSRARDGATKRAVS